MILLKRIGNVYERIASLDNCIQAVINATRYKKKRNRPGTKVFEYATNPHYYGYLIQQMLLNKEFEPSKPNHFFIKEGIKQKQREIFAPKLFPDQMIHWAIIQVIGPMILNSFYEYSCGSLPQRGPSLIRKYLTNKLSIDTEHHKKVRTTYKYCLKLDIHHFFQSINREIMMNILETKFKDRDLLHLMRNIIYMPDTGTGLPIGFYTSQWMANLYLDKFDHWLKKRLAEDFNDSIYIRYVDDLVIVASNKRKLARIREEIAEYLKTNLDLTLKYDSDDQIFDIGKRPIDFVGFKFTYGKTTTRNSIFRNAINSEKALNNQKYGVHNLSSVISYNGWLNVTDCYTVKHENYKHSDKFYKMKLKVAQQDPSYKNKVDKIVKISNLRSSIYELGKNSLNNGFVTRYVTEKTLDGYVIREADKIKVSA